MAVPELTMALSSIKGALELIKLISESRKDSIIKEKTIDLRNTIMDIQMSFTELYEKYSALLSENDKLKKEIKQIHQWEVTKSHYDLMKSVFGTFVYAPNKSYPNIQPLHYLCTNCYDNGKKSILQVVKTPSSTCYIYECPSCNMKINFDPFPK